MCYSVKAMLSELMELKNNENNLFKECNNCNDNWQKTLKNSSKIKTMMIKYVIYVEKKVHCKWIQKGEPKVNTNIKMTE